MIVRKMSYAGLHRRSGAARLALKTLFVVCIVILIAWTYRSNMGNADLYFEPPEYTGEPFIIIGDGTPDFTEAERKSTEGWEIYSPLDEYGRCGSAYANLCPELMPEGERGSIGDIRPTGWHTVKYPDLIEDRYLYNRCHLIAFSLAGENDNELNLITGTRYMNVSGMLPFEIKVADYIERTHYHVLYRVTPVFLGSELVARGVIMEAYSVEDSGGGLCFKVYCFNVQPGIEINYATGESRPKEEHADDKGN